MKIFKPVREEVTGGWNILHNKNFIHKILDFLAVNIHTVVF
jgi:hypothetical protein